jgi:hypothetical protein
MATPSVHLTPIKQRRDGVFSTRLAGGRMPLTPSPQTPRTQLVRDGANESIHNSSANLMARFTRSISKTNVRDSPKSNIASRPSPRRTDNGFADLSLTGTGPRPSSSAKNTPSRTRRTASVQRTPKRSQGKINYTAAAQPAKPSHPPVQLSSLSVTVASRLPDVSSPVLMALPLSLPVPQAPSTLVVPTCPLLTPSLPSRA